jgi:hypothetical protein
MVALVCLDKLNESFTASFVDESLYCRNLDPEWSKFMAENMFFKSWKLPQS